MSHHRVNTARRCWPRRRGFTLVEAVAAMVILGALGSVVSAVVLEAMQGYSTAATGTLAHEQLTSALERLDRELREIDLKSGSAVAPDITSITPTSITFSGGKAISLTGTTLNFTDTAATTTVMLDAVSAFTIAAFDEANVAMAGTLSGAACDPVRRLSITLGSITSGTTDSLRTKIYLRNAMTAGGN